MSNIRYCIENSDDRLCYYITDESDELNSINLMEKQKDKNNNYYDVYNIYNPDLENIEKLIRFKTDYTRWSEEMKTLYNIDPKYYYSSNIFVMCFFKKYTKRIIEELKIEVIGTVESSYIEKTSNGGQTYLKQAGLYNNCYGVDYSGYYPNLLGNPDLNFQIPIKAGKQFKYTFEQILDLYQKKKLLYGFYDIKIKSNHPDILKVFSFSSDNVYNHYSLNFALRYRNLYKIEFEMLDEEYNAYIYNSKSIIKSSDIFGDWFKMIKDMKSKLPKNAIVKHLSSSLWGYLIQFNRLFITLDEYESRDDVARNEESDKKYRLIKYNNDNSLEIVDKENRYKNGGIARIKSFLTAFSRDCMSRMIIKEKIHDKIIRIQTDGIVLSESHKFDESKYYPTPERKLTGNVFFVNVNEYYNQCDKCTNFFKYSDWNGICPECN